MKQLNILRLSFFITLTACATYRPERVPSSLGEAPDYPAIFSKAREYLIAPPKLANVPAPKARINKISESDFVDILQAHPEWMNEKPEDFIAQIQSEVKPNPDLTKHTRLVPPPGQPGYSNVKFYATHPYYEEGKSFPHPKDNLVKEWIALINRAKKEIILNVFEFNLEEVAKALAKRAKVDHLDVRVGIDRKVHDKSPEVQAVANILRAGGVKLTLVETSKLNHQKIMAIDWSDKINAAVLFSSGNLTHSCISPLGDLRGKPVHKDSVPNANHLVTMNSWLLSNLVKHELTKTLDEKFLLKGDRFPLNGSYQVTGPGVDPYTLEAYPEPSLIITFAPKGGLNAINKNLISHFIRRETGSIRILQFAFSSKAVAQALRERAERDIQQTGKFDFMSLGDTPFALREFSNVLFMSGYKMQITKESRVYLEDHGEGSWWNSLGDAQMLALREKIFTAPKVYGDHYVKVADKSVKVNAKIHHKILATPNFAILGTSFNFSEGAEDNNEQLIVFRDRKMSKFVDGMLKFLIEGSAGTVSSEVIRRQNSKTPITDGTDSEDVSGL